MKPEVLFSETIYSGAVFDIRVDEIREGVVEYKRDVVVHRGSCVIIPIFEDGTVALVRQYRHAAGRSMLELAAGTLEDGEDPKAAAVRELEEEIGVTADHIEMISQFYVSPGFLTEKMYVFRATGLTHVGQKLEDDEILTIERFPLTEATNLVRSGKIEDAKTIIGLMLAARV